MLLARLRTCLSSHRCRDTTRTTWTLCLVFWTLPLQEMLTPLLILVCYHPICNLNWLTTSSRCSNSCNYNNNSSCSNSSSYNSNTSCNNNNNFNNNIIIYNSNSSNNSIQWWRNYLPLKAELREENNWKARPKETFFRLFPVFYVHKKWVASTIPGSKGPRIV